MDYLIIVLLALMVGAVSVGFALAVTLLFHGIRWTFNQGRNSARKRPCRLTLLGAIETGAPSQIEEIAERRGRPAPCKKG